jgi:hypothetical protein
MMNKIVPYKLSQLRVLSFSTLLLLLGMAAQAAPDPILLGQKCTGCHALPPGSGVDDGRFKPGAHAEHAMIACDQCHTTGADDDHVNGVIALKPELEYQYGQAVPWPSLGSGSCGGLGHPFQPLACHERMPEAKCIWIPGKSCRPMPKP